MSLLVPDYSSSSEDEEPQQTAPVTAPAPAPASQSPAPTVPKAPAPSSSNASSNKKKRKLKKPKTTLYLPPEIQRLLESGGAMDDDDDSDDDGLLAKQKKAVAAKRARTDGAARSGAASSGLSFLPSPKNEVAEPPAKAASVSTMKAPVDSTSDFETSAEHVGPTPPLAAEAAAYYPQQQQYDASAMAQYPQPQQQQYADFDYDAYYAQDAESFAGGSSKRARNRDRELERALQQGNFHSVADKIVEVHGPSPHAWQAPESQRKEEGDMKVKASFWSTEKGTTVTSIKPSRLQRQRHQLNQLAFDAKAREFELLEKKGSSLKTKAETHAKYGW